jgi:hypothetical protein
MSIQADKKTLERIYGKEPRKTDVLATRFESREAYMASLKTKKALKEHDELCERLIENIRVSAPSIGMQLVDRGNGMLGFERIKDEEK